jgi:hypothetical protein
MKIALVFLTLLAVLVAVWQYRTRSAARQAEFARVLQLDPHKVEPSTRALLLLETIPNLEGAERGEAVKQLRGTLKAIPRGLVLHEPSFAVEAIRFSGDGRAVLWYGKTPDGLTVEQWSERLPRVVPWTTAASNATFADEQGTRLLTDEIKDRAAPAAGGVVMTSDGRYLARALDDVLWIWRVRDFARSGAHWPEPAFWDEVPHATARLHCVQSADLCGVEAPGTFTIIDVKKRGILRSISTGRGAVVHLSPSAGLVGVAQPRGRMTIHTVRNGRKLEVDTSSLALEDFAFSADEKSVVALGRDGLLHSYDVAAGKPAARSAVLCDEQWKSPAHVQTVGDGRFVVWGAEKVRLVSADLSTVTARFDDGGEVVMVKTNAAGDRLAIARRTGPLTLWDVSPRIPLPFSEDELLESVCGHIGRPLTPAEWGAYIPNRPYNPQCL